MKTDRAYVFDILNAAKVIEGIIQERTFEQFIGDTERYYACLYKLIVMGEATKRLSEETRQRFPGIDWRGLAGLRDVVAHQYDGIDDEYLWGTLTKRVPGLIGQLASILENWVEPGD
ncbi:MAG: DUF86 domain-containing protein [Deltaproteobacteria bacterium]|nr:DUF86 domain-containing protein [Deltaproteobacteria bacterium]